MPTHPGQDPSRLPQRLHRLRGLLADPAGAATAAPAAAGPGAGPLPAAAGMPELQPQAVLARLEQRLDDRRKDVEATAPGSAAAFDQARSVLLGQARPALQRLADAPPGLPVVGLDGDLLASLEAIVIADGSRPSFLLSGGRLADPPAALGPWQGLLGQAGVSTALPTLAQAVARIQPGGGGAARFIGTGTLVDAAAGLVLTNHHVVEQARSAFGVAMAADGPRRLRVDGALELDFAAEQGRPEQRRCQVVQVLLPAQAGSGAGQVDAALLRLAPLPGQAEGWPAQAVALAGPGAGTAQAGAAMLTIGFPDEPRRIAPPGTLIDWDFVVGTLFGNHFGVKRLAPGRLLQAPDDQVLWHDATVFGGASGSLVWGLADGGLRPLGLHFAGATGAANHAVPAARLADALADLGLG